MNFENLPLPVKIILNILIFLFYFFFIFLLTGLGTGIISAITGIDVDDISDQYMSFMTMLSFGVSVMTIYFRENFYITSTKK